MITFGNNKIIIFSSIGHPWQSIKWCELLVVTYMTIKWLLFKMKWKQWHDFSMQLSNDYILNNMAIDVWLKNDYYVMIWIILT